MNAARPRNGDACHAMSDNKRTAGFISFDEACRRLRLEDHLFQLLRPVFRKISERVEGAELSRRACSVPAPPSRNSEGSK